MPKYKREHTYPDPETHYIVTEDTLEEISEEWKGEKGCSFGHLQKRSANERWFVKRKIHRRKLQEKIEQQELKAKLEARKQDKSYVEFLLAKTLRKLGYPKKGEKMQEALEKADNFKTQSEAGRIMQEAIKLRRLILGDSDSAVEHKGKVHITFHVRRSAKRAGRHRLDRDVLHTPEGEEEEET